MPEPTNSRATAPVSLHQVSIHDVSIEDILDYGDLNASHAHKSSLEQIWHTDYVHDEPTELIMLNVSFVITEEVIARTKRLRATANGE